MANYRFIFEHEDSIIELNKKMNRLIDAYVDELNSGKAPYERNRDCWGTLRCNAVSLRNKLNRLLFYMEHYYGKD